MAWPSKLPTRFRWPAAIASLLLATAVGAPPIGPSFGQTEAVYVVVVSPDVPIDDLRMDELRRLFLFSKRHWRSGSPATILFSEDSLIDGSYLTREIYRMDFPAIRRLILESLYQGELDLAPKVVASDSVAVAFVASGSGLVSLVRAGSIGDAKVKVLTINGKGPESDAYLLRK